MTQVQEVPTVKMKVALKDIVSSPFRDFKLNPLRPKALEALEESIEATGYWGNALLRKLKGGKFETIAGHHRIKVLTDRHKKDLGIEYEFDVTDISVSKIQQRMARDHHQAFNHDLLDMVERVQFAVLSLAAGEIPAEDWPAPDPSTRKGDIRYAPSYIAGKEPSSESDERPYSATTLARFLGSVKRDNANKADRASDAVVGALSFLENIELQLWDTKTINTFRKADGSIPVDTVIRESANKQQRAQVTAARTAERLEQQRKEKLSIEQRLKEAEAATKAMQEENDRRLKKIMADTEEEDKAKAKAILEQQKQNAINAKAAEKRRAELKKEYDANEKARAASLEQQRRDKESQEKRIEAARLGLVKTARELTHRILTNEDVLFEHLKKIGRDKLTTDKERNTLIADLEEASSRVLLARVLVRPELGKKN